MQLPSASQLSLSLFRKESSFNLGSAETKLLLTMHWIMVDAPDECVLETADKNPGGIESGPFAYLFPLSAITVSEQRCGLEGRGLVSRMQKEVTFQGEARLQTDQYNDFVASEDQMSPTRLHVPFRLEWKLEGSHPYGVALKSLAFPYFPLLLKRHKKWSESKGEPGPVRRAARAPAVTIKPSERKKQ